jgi:hypothetical protein
MDGKSQHLWVEPTQAAVIWRGTEPGDLEWLAGLLRMGDTLKNVQQVARRQGDVVKLTQEQSDDGGQISVLTIEAKAISLRGNDWVKAHMLLTSDTKQVYRFDAQTKLFDGLQIWVHSQNQDDVLIFETTQVEYPDDIPDSKFTIDLPPSVPWQRMDVPSTQPVPPELSRNRKPDAVARSFFDALSAGDKDRVQEFFQIKMNFPDNVYAGFRGLTIVDIGKPTPGLSSRQWFVPYEIQLTSGETKKFNLNVCNDNPSWRWYVDGGF